MLISMNVAVGHRAHLHLPGDEMEDRGIADEG
jgi:hypothetical protein